MSACGNPGDQYEQQGDDQPRPQGVGKMKQCRFMLPVWNHQRCKGDASKNQGGKDQYPEDGFPLSFHNN